MERPFCRNDILLNADDDTMSRWTIPKILLLAHESVFLHRVREVLRSANLRMTVHLVATREDFSSRLRAGEADMIVASEEGLPELPSKEIMEYAHQIKPGIPVLIIGNRVAGLAQVEGFEYLQTEKLDQLPEVIEHILWDRKADETQTGDVLDMKRAAEVLRENQKLVTIGRLAGSIAHEINNPLESVTNLLYLIEMEHGLSERVQHYLSLAQRELARVVQISKQTLNFYRETAAPVEVSISSLVEEVLVLFARKITEKDLKIQRQYEQSETVTVWPGEMRQVLSNLITNAIEASSKGGKLFLRIRSGRKWSDAGIRGVRVSIGDTGGGIQPEVRHRLGEPFFTTKGQSGTGLGLWVTQSIIHRYGGELQLRSAIEPERHGTVFSFFLPTNLRPQAVPRAGGGTGIASMARMAEDQRIVS